MTGLDPAAAAESRGTTGRGYRRRRLYATLALIPLGGAAFAGPTAWQVYQDRRVRLAPPAAVAGLALDRSPDAQAAADYARSAVAAGVRLDATVGAVYADPGDRSSAVMFVGGTGTVLSPPTKLHTVLGLLGDAAGLRGVRDVDAGRLGGTMRCGTSTGSDGDLVVCGWSDHGSVGAALFPGRTVDAAAVLMRQLREATEVR